MQNGLKNLFNSGNYLEVLEHTSIEEPINAKFKIGSLIFLGREIEARQLLKELHHNYEDIVEAHFYTFLSSIKNSDYNSMKADLLSLHRLYRLKRRKIDRFYLYQAVGLIRYYLGEFGRSYKAAKNAFEQSIALRENYLSMIATDLLGHSSCMLEHYGQGSSFFDQSLVFAKKIQNNNNIDVIKLSRMIYKIESGTNLPEEKENLELWIKTINPQDYYTKTNALILKTKLYQLQGSFGKSEQILEEIGQSIFTHKHNRQILNYNLNYSYQRFLTGQKIIALNIIKNSLQLCDKGQDFHYMQKFKELEFLILQEADSVAKLTQDTVKELNFLSKKTGRKNKKETSPLLIPEDKVFQMLGKITDKKIELKALQELKKSNLLGLVSIANLYPKEDFIDYSLNKRAILISVGHNIELIENLSSKQFQLIKIIVQKNRWTKRELFEKYWSIPYDSFIHSNKLYVTLKRLKNKLSLLTPLFSFEKGDIIVKELRHISNIDEVRKTIYKTQNSYSQGLNRRQIQFLENIEQGEMILPKDYANTHQVSRNTVSRDLKDLENKGFIRKHGEKRGTFYIIN